MIGRHKRLEASATLREIFGRLVFNILCGNTDDHARNHAAVWDGESLRLTPAFDICPQNRTGNEASQAMLITGAERLSRISSCLDAARHFLLSRDEAIDLVGRQVRAVVEHWNGTCDDADLGAVDRTLLRGRQFLNPLAFEDLEGDAAHLKTLAEEWRAGAPRTRYPRV